MKLLAALAGLMLVIAAVSFAVFRLAPEGDCVDRVRAEAPSPDGRAVAAIYEHDCGGAVATRVALRRPGAFVARGDVAAFPDAPAVELRWDGPRALQIRAPAAPLLAENAWHDVAVQVLAAR